MKSFLKPFIIFVLIFFTCSNQLFAIQLSDEQIMNLLAETKALRREVNDLKKELVSLKGKKEPKVKPKTKMPLKKKIKLVSNSKKVTPTNKVFKEKPKSIKNKPLLGGYAPVISPNLGATPSYNGSDLITNFSEQNTDLLALQYRQVLKNVSADSSDYFLVLSGAIGAQLSVFKPYIGSSLSDLDLTIANITTLFGVGPWITGFLSLDYDNFAPYNFNPPQYAPRAGNSRLFLDEGFLTLGNLDKKDWYLSVGQMYIPFGQYNSFGVNSPLTSSLFTTLERPVVLGFSHSNAANTWEFDARGYIYHGETATNSNSPVINEWGIGADYFINQPNWNTSIGLGYVSNIADSEGFQLNGQNSLACQIFGGFAFPCGSGSTLKHRVSGFDINGSVTINSYTLLAEYITALDSFALSDLSFDRRGARPQAFDLEGSYGFLFWNKPSSLSLGYAYTRQALALLLPAKQYSITFTTSLWQKTTESLAFQRDYNYGHHSGARGQELPVYLPADRANLGRISNTVILAMSAYF